MRTANPALSETSYQRLRQAPYAATGLETFTAEGAISKTALLLVLVAGTAVATMTQVTPQSASLAIWPASLIGLGFGIATAFKPTWARITAPLYALAEGVVIGGLTLIFNERFPGIGAQAALGTFAVLAVMLVLYRTGLIKVTERFRFGVIAATGAVCLMFLVSFLFSLFGSGLSIFSFANSSPLAIGFSLLIIAVAALNLVLDFDFIENADKAGLPKYAEWYAAFGLMVTLIWLYIEMLRLLARLRR